jgi:hypothetical protein
LDLSNPIDSVIPSAHGAVLAVLARTELPLSGRQVAALTDGRVGQSRTNQVLRELTDAGLVLRTDHPPAKAYVLNRRHVAADAVLALASLRRELLDRMIDHIAGWEIPPVRVTLFGSFARGDGGPDSDIDVLVVRRSNVRDDDPQWTAAVHDFASSVLAWSGNACSILEYTNAELEDLMASRDPVVASIRADGIDLHGRMLQRHANR